MADLVVIVPSRGRPQAAHELVAAFEATCSNVDTQLVFVIDERDVAGIYDYPYGQRAITMWTPSTTMVEALNMAASSVLFPEPVAPGFESLREDPPFAIGFMGDDHRPRTVGWDRAYLDALREMGTGIVYGNDLLQGKRLPTQCAMTSDIIRTLGYMAPPELFHMYVDDWWKVLGHNAGCLRYLPDVVVEHMHPVAGKADWDEGHKRVNAQEVYARDYAAYASLQTRQLPGAIFRVKELLKAAQP